LRYAPVAPVAKVKSVRRASAAKKAEQGAKRASSAGSPRIDGSLSPATSASSAVLAALDDLQFGG